MGKNMRFRRSFASVMVVGALSVSGLAVPAMVGGIAPEVSAAEGYEMPKELIDANRKGSITIKKRLNPAELQDPTGRLPSLKTDPNGEALGKVEFTLYRVNDVDLTTNEKYAEAAKLTVAEAEQKGLTEVKKQKTAPGSGTTTFAGLPVGLYLVKETDSSQAVTGRNKRVEGTIIPSAPFLVYLPMTNPERNEWNYDPQVAPKNSTVTVEKTVQDKTDFVDRDKEINPGHPFHSWGELEKLYTDAGEDISYTITTDIPAGALTEYKVVDHLDKEKLTFKDMAVSLGDTALTKDADFTVKTEGDPTVEFTEAGLQKLADARKAGNVKVKTVVTATVKAFGGGEVKNKGTLITNGGSTESNEVVTKYGALNIFKHGEGDKPLQGAKFKIRYCDADGEDIGQSDGNGLTINGKSEWESDANGKITIDGLHVTDFANNANDPDGHRYCLTETQAPEGYELRPEPIPLTFASTELTEGEAADGSRLAAQKLVKVENVNSVAPKLPATGGMGIGILMAIGAAVIGAGVWFARRTRS